VEPSPVAHSFVIRVWLEETSTTGGPTWRGHITHVMDRRRQYVQDFETLVEFISSYLVPAADEDPPG
jgi:hypothetical protein